MPRTPEEDLAYWRAQQTRNAARLATIAPQLIAYAKNTGNPAGLRVLAEAVARLILAENFQED